VGMLVTTKSFLIFYFSFSASLETLRFGFGRLLFVLHHRLDGIFQKISQQKRKEECYRT
jgi:hypothetical protein